MIYKASFQLTLKLLELPESGMGYQIINTIRNGNFHPEIFIVYNSELVVDSDHIFTWLELKLMHDGFSYLVNNLETIKLFAPTLITNDATRSIRNLSDTNMQMLGRYSGGSGAIYNEPKFRSGSEIFVRLSTYYVDKRVDLINKKLRPGTYTTTAEDYLQCKKLVDDPIDRYALPIDETIQWAFFIKPKSVDPFRLGFVQPANNQSGGGIEAFFEKGTSTDTLIVKKSHWV
jgi:hypothetical protein